MWPNGSEVNCEILDLRSSLRLNWFMIYIQHFVAHRKKFGIRYLPETLRCNPEPSVLLEVAFRCVCKKLIINGRYLAVGWWLPPAKRSTLCWTYTSLLHQSNSFTQMNTLCQSNIIICCTSTKPPNPDGKECCRKSILKDCVTVFLDWRISTQNRKSLLNAECIFRVNQVESIDWMYRSGDMLSLLSYIQVGWSQLHFPAKTYCSMKSL